MCCALRYAPVTDFRSDHPFRNMNDRDPISPQRRKGDTFPVRSLPSRESIEMAQPVPSQSQNVTYNRQNHQELNTSKSPSPSNELQDRVATRPSAEQLRQTTSRSPSSDFNRREKSYSPIASSTPDQVPSGQVCR